MSSSLITGYKTQTVIDSGGFYCPYIPLTVTSTFRSILVCSPPFEKNTHFWVKFWFINRVSYSVEENLEDYLRDNVYWWFERNMGYDWYPIPGDNGEYFIAFSHQSSALMTYLKFK